MAHYDPLARAVSQRLHAVLSCSEYPSPPMPTPTMTVIHLHSHPPPPRIPVVYSSEVPSDDVTLFPLANSELAMGSVDELAPCATFACPPGTIRSAHCDLCAV